MILSENEFEEVQFIGSKPLVYLIKAQKFPEKLRIMDMIECKDDIWHPISAENYKQIKEA